MNRDLSTSQQPQQQQHANNRDEHVIVAPAPKRRGGVARRSSSFMRRTPSTFKSSDTLDSIAEAGNYASTMKPIRRKSSQDLNVALGIFHQHQQQQHQRHQQPRRASDGNHGDEIGPPIFLEADFDGDDDDDDLSIDVSDSLMDLMDECTLGDECSWDAREFILDDDSDDDSVSVDDDDDSLYEHSYANDSRRIRIARPNKLMNSDSFATHGSSNWSCMMGSSEQEDLSNTSFTRNDTIHHRLPCNTVNVVMQPSNIKNKMNKNNMNRRTVGASSSMMTRTDSCSTIGSNITAAQEANPQRFLTPANSFTCAAKGVSNNDANDDHVTNIMACDLAAMTTRDFPVVQHVRNTVDPRKFQMANWTMFKLPFGSSSSDLSHMVTTTTTRGGINYEEATAADDDAASKCSTTASTASSLSYMTQNKYRRRIESPFASPNPAVMTPSPKMSSPIRLPFRTSDSMLMRVPSLDHDHDQQHDQQQHQDLLLGSLSSSPTQTSPPTSSHNQGPPPPPMSPTTRFGGLRRKESIHRL